MLALTGAGVGGGSLVYANVLWEPPGRPEELAPYYALARRMLGATPTPFETPADEVMRDVARELGVEATFGPAPVGVWFGEDGVDPYFGGAGPLRNGCTRCGGCMVGCRFGAKNTLDRNYLWFAERLGAEILPEREATRIVPVAEGFEVEAKRPGWSRRVERFRAAEVVLAAGPLGTTKLLLASGLGGDGVGSDVRTNSEALVGAAAQDARGRLLRGRRDRLPLRGRRRHARGACALPEGLERDGSAGDDPRRRRRPRAAPAAVPRPGAAAPARSSCSASPCVAGRSGRSSCS